MKKSSTPKLKLSKNTVAVIAVRDLADAAGGRPRVSVISCHTCGTDCPWI